MISPGDKLKHYEILEQIGKGGMGEVYLAKDTILDRNVAIKFLPEELQIDARARVRLVREAKAAASLDHPFICKIYETGEFEGKAFIVMEYIEGKDLREKLDEGVLPLRDALQIALEIAEALEEAHEKNIVHRDLKPSNVMITPRGHVKVMDFGLAKHFLTEGEGDITQTLTQDSVTEQGAIVGTLAYMSPEQARGEVVDARSDIFSLGIIIFEMTTGRHPFSKANPLETLTSILRDATPAVNITPRMLNPILSPILRKALAKEPENRYQNIKELVEILRKLLRDISGRQRVFLRTWPVVIGSILIVAMLSTGIYLLTQRSKFRPLALSPIKVTVLLADFENKTGDPVFDGVLETTLGFSLDNASFISIYDTELAHKQAIEMKPSSEGILDLEMAQLICLSKGIYAVITASIEPSNGGYLITARAIDPSSSREYVKAEQKINSKQDVLKVPDVLAARLQTGLVEIPEDSKEALLKETFTTTSLEAMKAYIEAQDLKSIGKEEEAITAYQRAIDYDPNFARAYAGLAVTYYALRDIPNTEKNYKRALDLIAQRPELMTDREKYRTRGGYYLSNQNYKRAIEEYSPLVEEFPEDKAGHTNLALSYFLGYRMAEAFEEGLLAVELDPENLDYRYNQSWYALASGDFESSMLEARKTLEIDPSYAKAFVVLALAELAQGRPSEAIKIYGQIETLSSELGSTFAATGLADLAIYEGRLEDAIAILTKGITFDLEKSWGAYFAADKYLMLAQTYLLQGKNTQAVATADKALETYSGEVMQFAAALIYIEAGQVDKARRIYGELNGKFQDIHLAYAKLVGGYLALKRGETATALKLFDESLDQVDTYLGRFALGRAYLEAGAFNEALTEFEKCEKRSGEALSIFLNDLPSIRYLDSFYYYFGRTQEGLESPTAEESFQKFLKIKENADAGLPLVEDARQRLQSL
jgi:serine/threonine protein kinase/Tfp pilus assembly protein PilF